MNPILFPWQVRWVGDQSRLKIIAKATQIGISFAESYSDVVESLERERNLFAILSRSERQALEFARKCKEHCDAIGAVAQLIENDSFEGTSIKQHVIEFPNAARIIVLTSNPDTARGYTGNVVLDEFAFHRDAKAVFAAAYGRATRGFKLRVISTPFGESGKFYELAKQCDLVSGRPPERGNETWSGHWCDIHLAAAEGLSNVDGTPIDVAALLAGVEDEDIRDQEYRCIFLSEASSWIAWEHILAASYAEIPVLDIGRDDTATDVMARLEELLAAIVPVGECHMGGDIGRKKDLTVFWPVGSVPGTGVLHTLCVVRMRGRKFSEQRKVAEAMIEKLRVRRLCQDATGIGAQLAEELQEKYGASRVEPIEFTMPVKEDLAVRTRRKFEDRAIRMPDHRGIQASVHAVKKFATAAGHFRFDAERTDAGHADDFWAIALAAMAAEGVAISNEFIASQTRQAHAAAGAYFG